MLSLVWFKRDLRVADHPALAMAAAQGPVLPLYIIEPEYWAQPEAAARHYGFVTECLADLQRDLAALGQPLLLRDGDAVTVLERLRAKHRFTQIISHKDSGSAWSRARGQRVAAWAREAGLRWLELDPDEAPQAEVTALPRVAEGTGALPSARSLKLPEDRCDFRQKGGREAGVAALQGFIEARAPLYPKAQDTPVLAERGSSRLSAYLAYGALSQREVAQAAAEAKAARRGQVEWVRGLRRFERQVAQRRAGASPEGSQDAGCEGPEYGPDVDRAVRFAAWSAGETGLPFVDASMRYLRATGWLNARMRGLLWSVARFHLGLDARAALHLARSFTDYDPALFWPPIQQIEGAGRPMILDPVKQGILQDPSGAFIRRWLPELAALPDAALHRPWASAQARRHLAGRYPEPVVDPVSAAKQARAVLARQAKPRPISVTPRRAPVMTGQMSLDL